MTSQRETARTIAFLAHRGQVDKAGEPYFGHCERVAQELLAQNYSDRIIAVGYLHDVLEDTELEPEDLEQAGIDEDVIAAVIALTHERGIPNPIYWERVRSNRVALVVKIADVHDNSDIARLAKLSDDATIARLVKKYAQALEALTAPFPEPA